MTSSLSDFDSLNSSIQPEENENESTMIKFCKECYNMLSPSIEENKLTYKCERRNCDYKLIINSKNQKDNLVSITENSKNKSFIIDKEFCLDPTMPREKIICVKCGKNDAVFLISSDKEDTKIELIYICANPECGCNWKKQVNE